MLSKEEVVLENRKIEAIRGVDAAVRLLAGVVLDIKMLMIAEADKPPRKKAVKKGK